MVYDTIEKEAYTMSKVWKTFCEMCDVCIKNDRYSQHWVEMYRNN